MEDKKLFIKGINLILAFFLIGLIGISLYSYSPLDPVFPAVSTQKIVIHNKAGFIGAFISGILVKFLGIGAWLILFYAFLAVLRSIIKSLRFKWYKWISLWIFFFILVVLASFSSLKNTFKILNVKGGGVLGEFLHQRLIFYLQTPGTILFLAFLLIFSLYLLAPNLFIKAVKSFKKSEEKEPVEEKKIVSKEEKYEFEEEKLNKDENLNKKEIKITHTTSSKSASESQKPKKTHPRSVKLPSIDLLKPLPEKKEDKSKTNAYLNSLAQKINETLGEFGIQGEIVHISKGPVITVFEYKPAPGIKISKIASLNHDLALALKAHSIRIEAPIVGKDLIGIEVPNRDRKVVYLRKIIESKSFQDSKNVLPLALGVDVMGNPRVEDLAKMPHLLVAGATGSGKSVCLNTLIISLLFKKTPAEVKFLLIDPKRIELASYSKLPHLIHPVITDMNLAKSALEWAVNEMEKRYEAMAELNVRNIEAFNQKVSKDKNLDLDPMPYLVIVVDELADLMLTMGKEIEFNIVRLAQLARAAGIHVILATQRPSVDVVTGLIKANFPARIAFSVTSKHDSRTILDTVGAEHLLGKGDMLFKSTTGKIERIHGGYVSDEEITNIIDFWKENWQEEEEKIDFLAWKRSQEVSGETEDYDRIIDDPLYQKALDLVMQQGKASISMVQRHLRIGFNRAARFIEQMEKDGIIGPPEGSKPREVIKRE